jgi:hypothetical protein
VKPKPVPALNQVPVVAGKALVEPSTFDGRTANSWPLSWSEVLRGLEIDRPEFDELRRLAA